MANEVIKVLLVDDIPETRENLKKLLAFENDIEVVGGASTGREGLELAAETKPDIVLMDINMPDMDGITATEQLKKLVPSAAVVMMSVQSEADYLRRAMMAGARDFLTKPISGDDLYQTIRRTYDSTAEERRRDKERGAAQTDEKAGRKVKSGEAAGNLIAVYSPQGGAGVTTIAANMASAMMREGTRVLLIDADMQFGDVGLFLNLEPKHTILEMVGSVGEIDEQLINGVMASHPSGLKVLMAPRSPEEAEKVPPAEVVDIIKEIRRFYDYIIIDMSKRLDDMNLGILDLVDRIVLVATQTLPSIKNVRIMLDLFQALEYPEDKIIFVMNRVNPERAGRAYIPIEAIEQNLKRKSDGRIPLDEKVFLSAVNQGVSVISGDATKSPAKDLHLLADFVKHSFSKDEDEVDDVGHEDESQRSGSIFGGIFRR